MSEVKVDGSKHEINKSPVSVRRTKKLLILTEYLSKQESRNNSKKVSRILKKSELERTDEEKATLARNLDIVKRIHKNRERRRLTEQRILETEDGEEVLQIKCEKLAKILQQSKRTVIYTGAGISTAASIPDYRGPQGVWTLLQKGEQLAPQDLSDAEPTMTHMCITRLHELGHVKHVVSQNCDGLHLRSDFPRQALSEVHGNMFIEICHTCKPHREYIRLFDVTENTGVRRHFTGRHCQKCSGKLKDTIVHFGEKGGMKSPYRWKEAVRAANKCDLILCLGTSLKILKKYACLWCMDRVKHKRPNLVIVNLQWTPKDESATLKINGRCDDVMERVMKILGYSVPQYSRLEDPIFRLAASLSESEMQTTSKKVLQRPEGLPRLRSMGISRTPSASDSDSCSSGTSSATSASSASNETSADDVEDLIDVEDVLPDFSVDEALSETEKTEELEPDVKLPTKEELYMSKSERICNEAKIAMQTKLVNAQIQEVFSSCQAHQEQHIKDISNILTDNNDRLNSARINGMNGFVKDSGTTSSTLQPSAPYDPLRGGPFDPGPASYEEKVAYLNVLQNQLEALKQKQFALKEQELHQYKHQRVPSQVNSNNVKKSNTIVNCHSMCVQQETSKVNTKVVASKKTSTKCEDVASLLASREKRESDGIRGEISELHTNEKSLLQQKAAILKHKEQEECSLMRQHQNEQLRLQQHCLIQEQILQQTNHCMTNTDELLKVFLFQQQLLTTQQNAQLHILGQKFHKKLEKLDQDIVKKQCEIAKKSHYLNNLEKVEQESEHKVLNPLVSILKGCSNDISYSSSQHGINNQKRQKVSEVVLTGKNKQDCRIVTVLQDIPGVCLSASSSPTATSKIPNLNKLVENLSTCESCRFLKSYNFTKQRCSQCDTLKAKHGIAQSPANISKFVLLSCKGTDDLTGTSTLHNTQLRVNSVVLNKALANCKTETNVNSTGNDVKEAFPIRDSDSINNEQSNLFALDSSLMIGNSCHVEALTKATSPLKQEILTQKVDENVINIVMSTSACQQITLQDIDNNAQDLLHINVSAAEQANMNKGNSSTCENREVTVSCIDFKLSYEDESIDIDSDTKINVSKSNDSAGNYCEVVGPKTATSVKTIRSCSHSAIYDAHKCCLSGDIPGVRQLWSRSHNEPNKEKGIAVCVTVAESIDDCIIDGDGADNDGNNQSGQNNRTERKRKLLRCPSAPGWFGKGLNLKKRRKY